MMPGAALPVNVLALGAAGVEASAETACDADVASTDEAALPLEALAKEPPLDVMVMVVTALLTTVLAGMTTVYVLSWEPSMVVAVPLEDIMMVMDMTSVPLYVMAGAVEVTRMAEVVV